MKTHAAFRWSLLVLLLVTGCSSLPGLRVLTGQDSQEATANRVVETLDLVMADKTGATDPSLMATADRIEAATGTVDIIEIRPDAEADAFVVNMLYAAPQVPQTVEGQVMALDSRRRAIELTWQAVLEQSAGLDTLEINLLRPLQVDTLDTGMSYIGQVIASASIGRDDAALYLGGARNLDSFYGLILDGTMSYTAPETFLLYEGQPNHPLFMLSSTPA
jgi:hypothetical protein